MTTVGMSVQDSLWLTTDRPNNLMVVDGAMVLRGVPTRAAVDEVMTAAVERFPRVRPQAGALRTRMGLARRSRFRRQSPHRNGGFR